MMSCRILPYKKAVVSWTVAHYCHQWRRCQACFRSHCPVGNNEIPSRICDKETRNSPFQHCSFSFQKSCSECSDFVSEIGAVWQHSVQQFQLGSWASRAFQSGPGRCYGSLAPCVPQSQCILSIVFPKAIASGKHTDSSRMAGCSPAHHCWGPKGPAHSPGACAVRLLLTLSVHFPLLWIEQDCERWIRPWWCALGVHAQIPCKKVVCSLAADIKHRDCSTSSYLHLCQQCEYKPQLFPQFFQISTILCYVSVFILGPLLERHKAPAGYVSSQPSSTAHCV